MPRTISLSRGEEMPSRMANADWLMPSGFKNSSRSISPGCVGARSVGKRRVTRLVGRRALPGRRLVVVRDFDVVRIAIVPAKADAILLVDADAVLTRAIAAEPLEPVARGDGQFGDIPYSVQLVQFSAGDAPEARRACRPCGARADPVEQVLRPTMRGRAYHTPSYNGIRYSLPANPWSSGAEATAPPPRPAWFQGPPRYAVCTCSLAASSAGDPCDTILPCSIT